MEDTEFITIAEGTIDDLEQKLKSTDRILQRQLLNLRSLRLMWLGYGPSTQRTPVISPFKEPDDLPECCQKCVLEKRRQNIEMRTAQLQKKTAEQGVVIRYIQRMDTPSIDPFLLDPLEDNVVVSSGNESQDSFQSAISIPMHTFQSDPLADVPTTDPLTSNISNAPIIISRTSPPPLVPRVCPALPINLPPLAFFKPADTRQVSPQPSPKPIVEATESAQQTKRSSIFAMHIASKLQGLGLQQRSIVKDMINEVIFEAELGHLRMDHVTDIHEALRESLSVAPS